MFVREAIQKYSHLRPTVINKLMEVFGHTKSPRFGLYHNIIYMVHSIMYTILTESYDNSYGNYMILIVAVWLHFNLREICTGISLQQLILLI